MTTFTTRQAPWMKLGPVIEEDVDSTQAAKLGGLDFTVSLEEVAFTKNGDWHKVNTRRAVVRDDTDDFFGFVSDGYAPVQYSEAFSFMDQINPRYVSAGTLKGGRQGFMVVELPHEYDLANLEVKGEVDPHELYVIMRTSHDLSKGIEVALVTLRGKCMNQLTLPSMTANAPQKWSIRHVGDPHAKLKQAENVLTNADNYVSAFVENTKRLSEIPVSVDDAETLLSRLLPDRPKRDEQVKSITQAFEHSEHVGFAYTGWGLVNAVSEYFEWQRTHGRTDESYFTCGLEGPSHKYAGRTAQVLLRSA